MNEKKLKIVFFGTPEFAVASLDRLVKDGQDIAAVVTMPDKIAGRGHKLIQSDVKRYALSKGLRVLQPEKLKSPEFVEELRAIGADLFIVIAFRMLPEIVWAMPKEGTFNLHASLLPKYRGAAPINWAVINGETTTGVTTFFLKHEIDTGDIIGQQSIDILPTDNVGDVHDKLMELGAGMVSQTVKEIASGSVAALPQPEGEFIPAPKIFKDTCHIDWNAGSERIHNLVRGLSPYPAAWSGFEDSRNEGEITDVKIYATALIANDGTEEDAAPGNVIIRKNRMFVKTSDGLLEILSLQPAGKKRMDADAFLRGYKPVRFV
ncbi:MAG: methionyl-tRNA formyltransferase [Muribaculaceae bacterium]|nr:methionyl-tRNA formyltransferase [Muribaculaceae bacterium]MDE5712755.1 methionyl-tRNA formyltransferase [Muribaculaceae bacterium]